MEGEEDLRVLFSKYGCPKCYEYERAVNIFNTTVLPNEQVRTVYLQGPFVSEWNYKWQEIAEKVFNDEVNIPLPFMIFDGIVVKGRNTYAGVLAQLRVLNS